VTGGALRTRCLHLLVPGDPQTATGGYLYDRHMAEGLRALQWQVEVLSLDASFPAPTASALAHADQVLEGLEHGALVLIDGLALGAMPGVAQKHAQRLRLIALVHHPLALETGLTAARAHALEHAERKALQAVRHVIVTSRETAAALHRYAVPPEHIHVVEPGTDPAPLARHRGNADSGRAGTGVSLLCVATLSARKGHDLLFAALAGLQDRDWHLTCVGSADRDPETAARLEGQLLALGLAARITLSGCVSGTALHRLYGASDVFILPSRYEGYGMAVAEALMHGLPVIATMTGAIARLVPDAAGLLVPPGDAQALHAALARVLDEPGLRCRLGDGAWEARRSLRPWPQAARELSTVLQAMDAR
jgi:glycosyltransferase involved in cell wall biosynthesis